MHGWTKRLSLSIRILDESCALLAWKCCRLGHLRIETCVFIQCHGLFCIWTVENAVRWFWCRYGTLLVHDYANCATWDGRCGGSSIYQMSYLAYWRTLLNYRRKCIVWLHWIRRWKRFLLVMNRILIATNLNPSFFIPHRVSLLCRVLIIASSHYHLSRVLRGRWLSHDNWALPIDNICMLVVEGVFPNG